MKAFTMVGIWISNCTASQVSVALQRWGAWPYVVVLLMSCTLCSGSVVSGQRRMQGANTMAKALADIRLVSSCRAILRNKKTPSETRIKREGGRGRWKRWEKERRQKPHCTEAYSFTSVVGGPCSLSPGLFLCLWKISFHSVPSLKQCRPP